MMDCDNRNKPDTYHRGRSDEDEAIECTSKQCAMLTSVMMGCIGFILGIVMLAVIYNSELEKNSAFSKGICTVLSHDIVAKDCDEYCNPHPCKYPCYDAYCSMSAIYNFTADIYFGEFQSIATAKEYLNKNIPIGKTQLCYYNKNNYSYIILYSFWKMCVFLWQLESYFYP